MKPQSRVIQLIPLTEAVVAGEYLALCEDGSIWVYAPLRQKTQWTLCSEMEGGRYL